MLTFFLLTRYVRFCASSIFIFKLILSVMLLLFFQFYHMFKFLLQYMPEKSFVFGYFMLYFFVSNSCCSLFMILRCACLKKYIFADSIRYVVWRLNDCKCKPHDCFQIVVFFWWLYCHVWFSVGKLSQIERCESSIIIDSI